MNAFEIIFNQFVSPLSEHKVGNRNMHILTVLIAEKYMVVTFASLLSLISYFVLTVAIGQRVLNASFKTILFYD